MRRKIILLLALLALFLAVSVIVAAPNEQPASGGYAVPWWTVDGGGDASQGGSFIVRGTIGQPDAGYSTGGNYGLASGFWHGPTVRTRLHLPLIKRP
ncbi:MAG: hypothetical protein L0332_05240 [Chloroflexi bacterium]|nr:hypothetical protein [Chloroflexota bacterium]MCI0578012.1 hypothetical protein [Chloroflexota bacterium]MCI0646710.1 hypothetical protein [Chloroflexota bacterium]MCI0726111.1 hypothetical protein [Chloroflexota bacterium]